MNEIISYVGLVISICAFLTSYASYRNSCAVSNAQLEINLRNMVTAASNRMQDVMFKVAQETSISDDWRNAMISAAKEQLSNAYDEACDKYLDNKFDSKTFENLYRNEIIQLVEDDQFRHLYDTATTRYKAIAAVLCQMDEKTMMCKLFRKSCEMRSKFE